MQLLVHFHCGSLPTWRNRDRVDEGPHQPVAVSAFTRPDRRPCIPASVVSDRQRQTAVRRLRRDLHDDVTGGTPDGMLDGVGGGFSYGEQNVGSGGGIDRGG